MMLRTVICVCGQRETEIEPNAGWKGWGQVMGIMDTEDNTRTNPYCCPKCMTEIKTLLDKLEAK